MTESCSICKTDYEHISTDDDGDKHYKCSGGHFMVKTYRDDPDYDDLMDYWMGGGGYMPWQYQWTQQVILNQFSSKLFWSDFRWTEFADVNAVYRNKKMRQAASIPSVWTSPASVTSTWTDTSASTGTLTITGSATNCNFY